MIVHIFQAIIYPHVMPPCEPEDAATCASASAAVAAATQHGPLGYSATGLP